MYIHFVTLFPDVCKDYFKQSILGRAIKNGLIDIYFHNPIEKVPKLKRVDDKPYGGGPGMVLQAQPFLDCIDDAKKTGGKIKIVFLTPGGEQFTHTKAKEYSSYDSLILLCGRYEGIDERVAEITNADKIAFGNVILTGGELPAMAIADSVSREIQGVLGNENSLENTRISSKKVYSRPDVIKYADKEYSVPKVLLSGHHKNIDTFRDFSNNQK